MDVEIRFETSPWVPGMRASDWYGQVSAELFVPDSQVDDFTEAFDLAGVSVEADISAKARNLGANAVLSYELVADLWTEVGDVPGMRFRATGTAARLVRLF